MSEEANKSEFIVLGVVINKKGEVLIVKRKGKETTLTGKELIWTFPGGKQKKGETREERVVKEVLAETGYKIKPIKQVHLRIHPDVFKMMVYFLCELEKEEPIQEIKEKDEIEEFRWVKLQELKDYFSTDIDPEVKKILAID